MTPAGTSNELDVQNEWEENTHTHTYKKHDTKILLIDYYYCSSSAEHSRYYCCYRTVVVFNVLVFGACFQNQNFVFFGKTNGKFGKTIMVEQGGTHDNILYVWLRKNHNHVRTRTRNTSST